MLLNIYEVIYLLRPDIAEDKNLQLVRQYKNLIRSHGGKNVFIQHRGRRHLSYNINQYYDGIYVQINFAGNGHLVKLLEKSMKFNEWIIRYFSLKKYSNIV
jgi:small subunit ribosomal protein S6|uniref:30S ribosomal protein S6, chloroplastic n=1 Tax=Thorea hispida TaxID=202687 RepID=A0A1C9CAI0_9FLOR|nr:ribosomal protein S6 [Thorea hispida]AOM65393.1 ribosomal protein S6 [Thorea hispida]ARX95955.1 30S ribosomal protein S6 [Thorea hispida]UNJ79040.1 ribosomal protein S6 [Thorea hispida]